MKLAVNFYPYEFTPPKPDWYLTYISTLSPPTEPSLDKNIYNEHGDWRWWDGKNWSIPVFMFRCICGDDASLDSIVHYNTGVTGFVWSTYRPGDIDFSNPPKSHVDMDEWNKWYRSDVTISYVNSQNAGALVGAAGSGGGGSINGTTAHLGGTGGGTSVSLAGSNKPIECNVTTELPKESSWLDKIANLLNPFSK